ncbi:hypothetical protein ONE63_011539 [Megalurothrips usitatus]|uniref:Uncharacterized protein n=1 Tax=Megalurothrips usitatus TaxID=439358 RepID=A0AAV7X5D3_9NEOP|nr:hypothetical protein ONE63_011539 [Megalurothrips usitatus]
MKLAGKKHFRFMTAFECTLRAGFFHLNLSYDVVVCAALLARDADIDLHTFPLLDETTARSLLSPGSFLKFWPVFQDRQGEIKRNQNSDSELETPVKKRRVLSEREEFIPGICDSESDDNCTDEADTFDPSALEVVADELRKLFAASFQGKTLLASSYNERTDTDRNNIASLIICEELRKLKPSGNISRRRLTLLSRAIPLVFEKEDSLIFYQPFRKVLNVIFTAKGKLNNQYYYWRQKGVKAKILQPLRTTRDYGAAAEVPSSVAVTIPADVEKSLKWLNVNLGPEQYALDHWRLTFKYRMNLLDVRTPNITSVAEYYTRFPVLRQPLAVKLFKQDYDHLYPGTGDNFSINFPKFAAKLLLKLEKDEKLEKTLLDSLQNYLDQGHKTTESQLKAAIDVKVKWLQGFKKPLSFNPFPVIIGKDLQNVEKCLVVI